MDLLGRGGYMGKVLFLLEGGLRAVLSHGIASSQPGLWRGRAPSHTLWGSFLLLTCSPSLTPAALLSTGDEEKGDGFVLTTPRPHLPS